MRWRPSKLAAFSAPFLLLAGCTLFAALDDHATPASEIDAGDGDATAADATAADATAADSPAGDATPDGGEDYDATVQQDAGPVADANVDAAFAWTVLFTDDFSYPDSGAGFTPPWQGIDRLGDAAVAHGSGRFKSPPVALTTRVVTANSAVGSRGLLYKNLPGSHAAIRVRFHINVDDWAVPDPANGGTSTNNILTLRSADYLLFVQLRGKAAKRELLVFEKTLLDASSTGLNLFGTFGVTDQWRSFVLEVTLAAAPRVTLNLDLDDDAGTVRVVDQLLFEAPPLFVDPTISLGSDTNAGSSLWEVVVDDIAVESLKRN